METNKLYVEYIVVGMETLAIIFLVIFIIIGNACSIKILWFFSTKSNKLITSVWYCASGYWYGRNKWNWACQKVTSRKWKHCDYLHYEFHSVCSRGIWGSSLSILLKADFSAKLDSTLIQPSKKCFNGKQLVTIFDKLWNYWCTCKWHSVFRISSKNHCYALVGRKTIKILMLHAFPRFSFWVLQ